MSRSISRVLLSYGHLSRRTVAGTLQPPRERPGRPVAPIPVLLRIEFTATDAFTRRRVSSYLAFPPLPAAPQSPQPAVYLCCTFPEVAFGGRYPLSLPCGARTFLMAGLSPLPRGCPACLRKLFYLMFPGLSNLFLWGIIVRVGKHWPPGQRLPLSVELGEAYYAFRIG